jgi:hypothetical protein
MSQGATSLLWKAKQHLSSNPRVQQDKPMKHSFVKAEMETESHIHFK